MTPTQIELVQESFKAMRPIQDSAIQSFYEDLFATAPELKPHFAETDMAAQGRKLLATLDLVVWSLAHLEQHQQKLRDVARDHVQYGVTAADYEKVGACLLRMLYRGLGPAFTRDVAEAWALAYGQLSEIMIDASAERAGGRRTSEVTSSDT